MRPGSDLHWKRLGLPMSMQSGTGTGARRGDICEVPCGEGKGSDLRGQGRVLTSFAITEGEVPFLSVKIEHVSSLHMQVENHATCEHKSCENRAPRNVLSTTCGFAFVCYAHVIVCTVIAMQSRWLAQ